MSVGSPNSVLDANNLNAHNDLLNTRASTQDFDTKSIMSLNDDARSEFSVSKRSSFFFGRKKPLMTLPPGVSSVADPWRNMENTLERVGDWAQKALPVLLDIVKRGGRFDPRYLNFLRPSFRAAVEEARDAWLKKSEPPKFLEFVIVREQSGEELRVDKDDWINNNESSGCQLCGKSFGLKNRRHHCRACGALTCDSCSTKRLQLSTRESAYVSPDKSGLPSGETKDRVCDSCFNGLCHAAAQPSPDHFNVKQLKQCAVSLIASIHELIESLVDPDGEGSVTNKDLTSDFNNIVIDDSHGYHTKESGQKNKKNIDNKRISVSLTSFSPSPSGPSQIDVLKIRERKLFESEDNIAKFLSVIYYCMSSIVLLN